jgi:hypothetical protein
MDLRMDLRMDGSTGDGGLPRHNVLAGLLTRD